MDRTITKSAGRFIAREILRDDYLIIDETGERPDDASQIHQGIELPFQAKLDRLQSLCHDKHYLSEQEILQNSQRLISHYQQSQIIPTSFEIAELFLPRSTIQINRKHFGRQQDHAQLLKKVASATQGGWSIGGVDSRRDRKDNRWVVAYKGQTRSESFRFIQQSGWLATSFMSWLIDSAEYKSGYRISCHGSTEHLTVLCLPTSIHSLLIDNDAALLAA